MSNLRSLVNERLSGKPGGGGGGGGQSSGGGKRAVWWCFSILFSSPLGWLWAQRLVDSPGSALRPSAKSLVCAVVSLSRWCAALPYRQACNVMEDLVLFVYSVQHGCKFHWLLGLCALHLTGTPCNLVSTHLTSQVTCSRCIGDLYAVCSLQPSVIYQPTLITASTILIPECNGLSQYAGKPSLPVREFNLIACPPVQLHWKTPRPGVKLWLARVLSPSGQQELWPI